jgi:hypothetical protein
VVSNVAEKLQEITQEVQRGQPNARICLWCANREGEACLTRCRAEGRYRYLCPDALPSWEAPPRLPSMRELVDWPAAERLAMLWLVVHYQGEGE